MSTPVLESDDPVDRQSGVFAKKLRVPPGLPWDQRTAALLEAKQMAPLPEERLAIGIKRLGGWQLGRTADFAALYVKSAEARNGFSGRAQVDGRTIEFRIPPLSRQGAAPKAAVGVTLMLTAILLVGAASTMAIKGRMEWSQRLTELERIATRRAAVESAHSALEQQRQALSRETGTRAALANVLSAVDAAAADRRDGVAIEALHWRPEGVAVEVRGAGVPFADGRGFLTEQPLKPGVRLWVHGTQAK